MILGTTGVIVLLGIAFALGVKYGEFRSSDPGPRQTESVPSPETETLQQDSNDIRLFIQPARWYDPGNLRLNAFVLNATNKPIVWDNEFSLFLRWEVLDLDRGTAIQPSRLSDNQAVTPGDSLAKRLVEIPPGSFRSKSVNLSREHRELRYDLVFVDPLHATPNNAWEALWRIDIPETVRRVGVTLRYDNSELPKDLEMRMLGRSVKASGLPDGRFDSNIVELRLR
jgi:hypothetical protein